MFDISLHAFTLLLIRNPHNWHWHRVQFQSFTPLERALEHRASVHILPERAEKEKKRSQPPLERSALPECWNGCAAVTGPVLLNSRSQISWCSLSELSNKRCDLIRVLGGSGRRHQTHRGGGHCHGVTDHTQSEAFSLKLETRQVRADACRELREMPTPKGRVSWLSTTTTASVEMRQSFLHSQKDERTWNWNELFHIPYRKWNKVTWLPTPNALCSSLLPKSVTAAKPRLLLDTSSPNLPICSETHLPPLATLQLL